MTMPEFTGAYACHDAAGKLHQFLPGEPVPEWLRESVGKHLLSGPWSARRKSAAKPDPNKDPEKGQLEEPQTREEPPAGDAPQAEGSDEDGKQDGNSPDGDQDLSFTGDGDAGSDADGEPAKPATRSRAKTAAKK